MPRIGMEPLRRAALIEATIQEIGRARSLSITVAQIARRAGVSSALAHHYFGGKEQLFLAAMRHVLTVYGNAIRAALRGQDDPRARLAAIVGAGFTSDNFTPSAIAAWLNFYVLAQTSPQARRLLAVYHRRLHANLAHALRPMVGSDADALAERAAALIDGLYLRAALGRESGADHARAVMSMLDAEIAARRAVPQRRD